jgi:hypothetical protein
VSYRLKIHTGPTGVDALADALDGLSRVRVTCRGTEHVYVEVVDAESLDDAADCVVEGCRRQWVRHAIVGWARA